jgi:Flp pilus assembly protein TadD
LRARPIYTEARLRLASSLRRVGRAGSALTEYQQVLSGNADLTEARLGEAMTLVQLGRDREARDRLAQASKTGPDRLVFTHALARLLAASRDDSVRDAPRAMSLVQELLQQGRTLELGETMAMTLAALGEFERAAAVQRDLLAGASKAGLVPVTTRLAANLASYERREPCRTPWAADEMP